MKAQEIMNLLNERLKIYRKFEKEEYDNYIKEDNVEERHELRVMHARYRGAELAIKLIIDTIKANDNARR